MKQMKQEKIICGGEMNPNPKMLKVNLLPKDYQLLRDKLYRTQNCCCLECGGWKNLNMLDMHHIKHRWQGDDSEKNCILVCRKCHNDIHGGKFMQDRR